MIQGWFGGLTAFVGMAWILTNAVCTFAGFTKRNTVGECTGGEREIGAQDDAVGCYKACTSSGLDYKGFIYGQDGTGTDCWCEEAGLGCVQEKDDWPRYDINPPHRTCSHLAHTSTPPHLFYGATVCSC